MNSEKIFQNGKETISGNIPAIFRIFSHPPQPGRRRLADAIVRCCPNLSAARTDGKIRPTCVGRKQRDIKASQSLPPAGGKGILIISCRGAPQGGLSCPFGAIHLLYLTENTYQAASLAPQRCAERNRQRRLLARSCAICTPLAYKSCARQTAILLSKKGKALF